MADFKSSDLDRLLRKGRLLSDEDQTPSKKVEDWQPMPRGSFRLTERALEQARAFADRNRLKGERNVLAFFWAPTHEKGHGETEWQFFGPRLILGAYSEADVPAAAVEHIDGLPLLFLFDPASLPEPEPTAIDFDGTEFVFA